MTITLEVKTRDDASADVLRASGFVPAVLYGPKVEVAAVSIDARALDRVWKDAGETTIVNIVGIGESKETLIKEIQTHPVSGTIIHADFYVLEKGKKIEIAVPLSFDGEAPAEKMGHVVVKTLHEIEIEVAPAELPHSLHVDMTKLVNVGDQIVVADIVLPKSAVLKTEVDEIVALVAEMHEEKEEPVATVPAATEAPTAVATETPAEK
jgi:large subunit ribosomal protein L25